MVVIGTASRSPAVCGCRGGKEGRHRYTQGVLCEVYVASVIYVLSVGGATVVENRDSRGGRVVGGRAYVFVAFSVCYLVRCVFSIT